MIDRHVGILVAAAVLASPVQAQRAGTLEVGLFPNIAYFDKTLLFDQGSGGPGGRLGFFITDRWLIEAEGSWNPVEGPGGLDISYLPLRGRIGYNAPIGDHSAFVIGAGYHYSLFRRDADFEDNGPTGAAGFRFGLGDLTTVRVNFYVDYIPSPENLVKENWNWGIQPGLSFMLGGRGEPRVRDRDGDGVPDAVDECRDTPAGDRVDARGCTVVDADGDGVPDDADQCADTPAGEQVDAAGCSASQRDSDGDGVNDTADRCPNTPAGEQVDAAGCSAGQRDSDGDGVDDAADQCADTPAGEQVDARGCPLPKDGDGDGVNDDQDRCPSTPAGVRVDEEGCQVLFEEKKKTLILEGVNFETGQATLTPESQTILNGVAESLVANEEIRVQVSGHTDITGSRALNQRLSRERAESVRQYLIERGVAADRLTAVGFGPDRPVASNRTIEGRAQNRRVELTRIN